MRRAARLLLVLAIGLSCAGCGAGPTGSAASAPPPTGSVPPAGAAATAPGTASGAASTAPGTPSGAATTAPVTPSAADRLQGLVEQLRDVTKAPGALGVLLDGEDRLAAALGTLDREGATPATAEARFRIGSITKPIVAAIVLTAVDRGELDLDAGVADLLPGVLRADPPVTVRQVLAHTSGVFDEGNEGDPAADIARLADPALLAEGRELLARRAAGEPVVASARLLVGLAETHDRYFAPGTGYHYSNTNYQLAVMVAEQATGRSIADLLRERIVEPLGLRHTTITPPDLAAPDLRGYDEAADGTVTDTTDDLLAFGNGGNGGIVSTADEVLAILRSIVRGELFGQDLVEQMATPVRESYGLGLATTPSGCGPWYGHGGSVNGTRSTVLVSRDGSIGIVLAYNLRSSREPRAEARALGLLCRGR